MQGVTAVNTAPSAPFTGLCVSFVDCYFHLDERDLFNDGKKAVRPTWMRW